MMVIVGVFELSLDFFKMFAGVAASRDDWRGIALPRRQILSVRFWDARYLYQAV
jgi:hypothetical protein